VFVGACNGLFFGVNRHTGTVEWRYDIRKDGDQTGFHGRWLLTADLVIVATDGRDEGFVYAFEQASGVVRWKSHVGRPVPSDVIRHGQLIYVLTQDDSLVALELATGTVRWRFAPPESPRLDTFVSSPIIAGDQVVIAGRDGAVYALHGGNGRVAWQHQIGAATTSPVVAGDLIYVGIVSEDRVIALSAASGSRVAQARPTGSLTPYIHPVVTDWGLSIVTGATLELWTADLSRLLWQVRAPAQLGRSPVVWNDKLVGGTVRGHLVAYHATDGQPAPTVQLSGVVTGLVGFDDVLYVGTQEGTLYAVRP
jgi:outer membrane protein assembly factor BamB